MDKSSKLSPVVMPAQAPKSTDRPRSRAVEQTYKPARQKRSAETERRLLNAAESLFAKRGFDGTKISDIIEKSGCSIGSFYHRFGDKDGLAKVMVDRYLTDAMATIHDADFSRSHYHDLRSMLAGLSRMVFDFMTARLGVYRAAQHLAHRDPEIWHDTGYLSTLLRDRVCQFTSEYAGDISAPNAQVSMTNAVQLIVVVILQTRLGAGALFPQNDDEFLIMITDAAMGLLRPQG